MIARPCESTTPTFNCTSEVLVLITSSGSCAQTESWTQEIKSNERKTARNFERHQIAGLRKYDCFIWKGILRLFTEYPGKQDFLQFPDIGPSRGCLQETGQSPYNLPVTFRRAKCGLSCFPDGRSLETLDRESIDRITRVTRNRFAKSFRGANLGELNFQEPQWNSFPLRRSEMFIDSPTNAITRALAERNVSSNARWRPTPSFALLERGRIFWRSRIL